MKYKMPAKSTLKSRSSTISNAFAISITPYIVPSEDEVKDSYKKLDIKEGQCAYCLGEGNGKDHLKPLVKNGMPTGYITSINNLVPCCSQCNSSKGARSFSEWYLSKENIKRLKKKHLSDDEIKKRYDIIIKYENQVNDPIDYEKIVGTKLWNDYQVHRKTFLEMLNKEQEFCDMLSKLITDRLNF